MIVVQKNVALFIPAVKLGIHRLSDMATSNIDDITTRIRRFLANPNRDTSSDGAIAAVLEPTLRFCAEVIYDEAQVPGAQLLMRPMALRIARLFDILFPWLHQMPVYSGRLWARVMSRGLGADLSAQRAMVASMRGPLQLM